MNREISSFISGGLFGAGLLVSQMTSPSKVIAFLDVFGNWDPSLALVMASALVVTIIGYKIVLGKKSPLFDTNFFLPTKKTIDIRLISGAALFGIGWGLAGLCPGPALAVAPFAGINIAYFLVGMLGSIILFRMLNRPPEIKTESEV